jgi:hypothetical protein
MIGELLLTSLQWPYIAVVKKNVLFFERFFLQPLIPTLRISELIFEKRCNQAIFSADNWKNPANLSGS